MQNLKLLIPLALFIGAFFVACHEEDPFTGSGNLVDVTFAGRIIDENGDPIQDAIVEAGGSSILSDKNGAFRLNPVKLPAAHAMVTVKKAGFFEISRPYIVKDEALQVITIQLLIKNQAAFLNGSSGGKIQVSGGPSLNFPANALTDANGNLYTGTATVYARYLDPSDPNLAIKVPGDMTAENAVDQEVFLATYGMVGVEIEAANGQKLNIASGKEVELRMPIIASQIASAPAQIPLWHYDLEEGHWREEGSAQKVGNEYVGKVTHFSFWNCDAPFDLTQLHGKIYLQNTNRPLVNACVRITLVSNGASSFGYTDGEGNFGGCVPKNEVLTLEVMVPENCGGQVFHTQSITPLSGETTLPDILIPSNSQLPVLQVTGRLIGCNGQGINNGYLKFELNDDSKFFLFADADGEFDIFVARCSNTAQTGSITGYDLTNLLESSPTSFSVPTAAFDAGEISVCTALAEYIRFTLDGGSEVVKVDPRATYFGGITQIGIVDSLPGGFISFNFQNSAQAGTYPIDWISVNQLFSSNPGATLTTNVTNFGNIGDLIIGNFGGNFLDGGGINHTLTGSYRVIRE